MATFSSNMLCLIIYLVVDIITAQEQCESLINNGWTYCSPSNCEKCTPCDIYEDSAKRLTGTDIDFDLCSQENDCLYKGELCAHPECIASNGWRYCPENDCRHCQVCPDMITNGDINAHCDDDCKYKGFPCIFNECKIPFEWEYCEVDDCVNCKSCDDITVACDDPVKCEMSTSKARCIRKKSTKYKIIGGNGGLWPWIESDYKSELEKKFEKELGLDLGDMEEPYALIPEILNPLIPEKDRAKICTECCKKQTVYEIIECIVIRLRAEMMVIAERKKGNRDCKDYALILYDIITNCDCIKQMIISSDIIAKNIKGQYKGHVFNLIIYTDENGKICRLYIDARTLHIILSADCVPTTAPTLAPTPFNSSTDSSMTIDGGNCYLSSNYIFVDEPMSSSSANAYCQDTYNTSLATIDTILDVVIAGYEMEGDQVWIDACFDVCIWIDGQNTSSINETWDIVLYQDGYIDIGSENTTIPFLCERVWIDDYPQNTTSDTALHTDDHTDIASENTTLFILILVYHFYVIIHDN